jgi:two-component system sensor histidine kinase GlrK
MRVATKLAVGWGVLIVLFLGILAYDLSLVNRLARVNQGLSEIEFRAAAVSLEQSRRLAALEEFSRKLLVTRDPAYAERLAELTTEFEQGQRELRFLPLSADELTEVERLADGWRRLPLAAIADEAARVERGGEEERRLTVELVAAFRELRAQATSVTSATQAAVAAKVAAAARASGQARALSWLLVGVALAGSLAVLWLTLRSLNRPLRRLTEGIREVSRGHFTYHPGPERGDEFSRLEASFNEMVERLGELDEAKSRFVSHVSHELKTPLVATQETNKLLLEEIPGPLNARQKRMVELNLQGSQRLAGMIDKLLELSRLEAEGPAYDFRRRDLSRVVRSAVESFAALARDRGLELTVAADGEVPVVCDRDRIVQLVGNLLENAIKFSPQGGSIAVRVVADPDGAGDGRAVVEVADQGPGVPAEARQRIFERFVQLDPAPHGDGGQGRGVGLGLAICREIVDAHQGEVWAAGNRPAGSVFGFSLPLVG